MRVATRFLEPIAVPIPDFQTWGLIASVFLSLYSCVTTLGFPQTRGIGSGLVVSLAAGYAATLSLNVANFSSDKSTLCTVTLLEPAARVAESEPGTSAQQSATIAFSEYRP